MSHSLRKLYSCIVAISAIISISFNSSAQTFQKLYGDSAVNDAGYAVIETSHGGFVIAGTQFDAGDQIESLFLLRTDSVGDTLWTRKIRETFVKYSGNSVVETFDGGFAITGIKGES